MDDDALLALGADLENRLAAINAQLQVLRSDAQAAERSVRKAGTKLAINLSLGIGGIALAPLTLGWSLIVTAGSGGMLIWDAVDLGRDHARHRPNRRELNRLRAEARELRDRLEAIAAVLDSRAQNSGHPD